MRTRTKTALGIDLGERRISAALVERTAQGLRVVAAATGDLPDAKAQQGGPSPAKVLSQVLKKLGRRAKTHGAGIAVAASTSSTVMRLLDLPRQMPTNISEFVDNELKQCVALAGRRRQSDFCGVGAGSGSRKRLLAVAADTDQVGRIVRTCAAAGALVDSVEPSSLAYARAFLASETGTRYTGNAMIAVLGAHDLVVCLFCKGMLDFVRIRDIPAHLEGPGPLCAWLTEELDAVLRYGRTSTPGEGAPWQARLVLHHVGYDRGDLACGLALEAGDKPLEIVDCCEPLGGLSGTTPDTCAQSPSAVAVGAAMKLLDVEGDELRIDLMPQEVVEARSSTRYALMVAGVAAMIILAVLLLAQLLSRTADTMTRRIRQTRVAEQLYTVPARLMEDRHLDQEIARIEKELRALQAARATCETDWPAVLETIGRATPEGSCVTYLACSGRSGLSLKGLALSYEKIRTFVEDLDGQAAFASVRLTRWQPRGGGTIVEYEIDCALKPVEQEPHGDSRS